MEGIEIHGAVDTAAERIAVCVGGQKGVQALKWALENIVRPHGHVCLLHVKRPLRWIPNQCGKMNLFAVDGELPVDQVNPEIVKRFEKERSLDVQKLVSNCTKLCNKIKVTCEPYYAENDSVQKEIVDQITKLGIKKLILETSSQNALTKALRKGSVSTYVAKHAPEFCSVLVICKGKPHYVKDASSSESGSSISITADVGNLMRSERSTSSNKSIEGLQTDHDLSSAYLQNGEEEMGPECVSSASNVQLSKSASMYISRESSKWPVLYNDTAKRLQNPVTKMMVNNVATLPLSRLSTSAPITPFYQGCHSFDNQQSFAHDTARMIVRLDGPTAVGNSNPDSPTTFYPEGAGITLIANGSHNGMMIASQLVESSNSDWEAFSQLSMELESSAESSTLEASFSQTSATEMEVVQVDINRELGNESLEFELLQRQLNEMKREAEQQANNFANYIKAAQNIVVNASVEFELLQRQLNEMKREAEQQANHFANYITAAENIVENAMKKTSEYERRLNIAVNDSRTATQKASDFQTKLQAALRKQETLQEKLAAEEKKNSVLQQELETAVMRVDLAERELQTERRKGREISLKLKEVMEHLEEECWLRKKAEERVSQHAWAVEALEKQYLDFSFEELQIATNHFHELNKLGQGSYGPVYKGKLLDNTVAIKVLAREGPQGREEFQKEVELLSALQHRHLVTLLGACPEKGCIVYQYMANGSLEDRLNCKDGSPPLPWYVRIRICLEIATALVFLQSRPQPIVHRDLKPGNILLDDHFVTKVSDVGLAKLVPANVTFSVTMYRDTVLAGTFAYMDPDYQRTGVVSCESDVYSLGIIMMRLLTGHPAVGVADLVEEAVQGSGKLEDILDESAGQWPIDEARALARLSLQCTEPRRKHRLNLESKLLPELERIQGSLATCYRRNR